MEREGRGRQGQGAAEKSGRLSCATTVACTKSKHTIVIPAEADHTEPSKACWESKVISALSARAAGLSSDPVLSNRLLHTMV